jgi:hypothetical protein
MLAVKADWAARGIPMAYEMFDSWWYRKDGDPSGNSSHPWPVRTGGGTIEWTPEPVVFESGLSDWLHTPTFLHNRCFSPNNVYLQQGFADCFHCDEICLPVEERLFGHILDVVAPWHPFVYEQDWISQAYGKSKWLVNNTRTGHLWLTAMNAAAAARNMTIQYSMSRLRSEPEHLPALSERLPQARTSPKRHCLP